MKNMNLLHVWNNLEIAKSGQHPYGGNITEMYAQHFVSENDADTWLSAGQRLYVILRKFAELNNVCIFVGGKEIGDWLNNYKFFHKCDIRVSKNESTQFKRIGCEETISENGPEIGVFKKPDRESEKCTFEASKSILQKLEHEPANKLIGGLEKCKVVRKKNIEPQLPGLLKRLWKAIPSPQNKKKAL